MAKTESWRISELCGTSLTGCLQRSEYAVLLLEGGSTVRKVLAYVDPPDCLRKSPCDWTEGWRNWQREAGAPYLLAGIQGASKSKFSENILLLEEFYATESF